MRLALPTRSVTPPAQGLRRSALTARISQAVSSDAGMTTAEYAVGTVAACGFGGLLYEVVKSPEILNLLTNVISKALSWLL